MGTQTTRKTYNAYMEKFLSFCVINQRSGCLKKVLRKGDHGNYEFDSEKLAKSLEEKSNPYSKYTYGIQKQAHKEGKAAFSRIEKVRCAMIYFFKSKSVALSQKARERVSLCGQNMRTVARSLLESIRSSKIILSCLLEYSPQTLRSFYLCRVFKFFKKKSFYV